MEKIDLSKAQIGKCGELFVQMKKLLECGIDSAQLTVDAGIDLVAFSKKSNSPKTIQIKATLKGKPSGGKGKLFLQWRANKNSTADVFAFVDLEKYRAWLIETKNLISVAQQDNKGILNFFMALDPTSKPRKDGKFIHIKDFEEHSFERAVFNIFL